MYKGLVQTLHHGKPLDKLGVLCLEFLRTKDQPPTLFLLFFYIPFRGINAIKD
jgi:hypothetical protein